MPLINEAAVSPSELLRADSCVLAAEHGASTRLRTRRPVTARPSDACAHDGDHPDSSAAVEVSQLSSRPVSLRPTAVVIGEADDSGGQEEAEERRQGGHGAPAVLVRPAVAEVRSAGVETEAQHQVPGVVTTSASALQQCSRERVQRDSIQRLRCGIVVSGVRRMNEVNARRARLVLAWVTVFGWVYHLGM